VFFLAGVEAVAEQATMTARKVLVLFDQDRLAIQGALGRSAMSALHVHDRLRKHAVASSTLLVKSSGLTLPTVLSALKRLQGLGIVREVTGQARNKVFVYERYLDILNAGVASADSESPR